MPDDIVTVDPDDSLKTWGWVSYILHLVVAIGAVLPGAQASIGLLLIALVIDLVKRDDAAGTWQASHFSWRIRSVIWAGVPSSSNMRTCASTNTRQKSRTSTTPPRAATIRWTGRVPSSP